MSTFRVFRFNAIVGKFPYLLSVVAFLIVMLAAPTQSLGRWCDSTLSSSQAGRTAYSQTLRNYFAAHPAANANKRALLNRHRELADDNYFTHLADSPLGIYDPGNFNVLGNPDHFTAASILGKTVPQAALNAQQPTSRSYGGQPEIRSQQVGLDYRLRARRYKYKLNNGYVDFAAKEVGGGVFGRGNLQEEVLLQQSNALAMIAQIRSSVDGTASFCPGVNLTNLDRSPRVFRLSLPFVMPRESEIYGRALEGIVGFNPAEHLTLRNPPVDIYLIAMAAPNYSRGGVAKEYSQQDIENMIKLAARAYFTAMQGMHQDSPAVVGMAPDTPIRISTGNWGGGAFANNLRAVWVIQRLALTAAIARFEEVNRFSPYVKYAYEAFDAVGYQEALTAGQWMINNIPAGWTIDQAAARLYEEIQYDPGGWDVRGSTRIALPRPAPGNTNTGTTPVGQLPHFPVKPPVTQRPAQPKKIAFTQGAFSGTTGKQLPLMFTVPKPFKQTKGTLTLVNQKRKNVLKLKVTVRSGRNKVSWLMRRKRGKQRAPIPAGKYTVQLSVPDGRKTHIVKVLVTLKK